VRRFPLATAGISAVATAVLIIACSSVPDFTFSDGGASSSGASSGGSSGASSGGSSGLPTDAPSDCKPTGPENCFDGIDNDCNGHIDCDDAACQAGSTCIDPAPVGWTLVSFSDTMQPGCATGYDTPADLKVVGGTGTGNCTCDCAPTPSTGGTACDKDNFKVIADTSGCAAAGVNVPAKTACTQLPTNIVIPNGSGVVASATPPPGPTACSATVTPAAGAVTTGRACSVAAATKFGKCIAANQVCAPKPTGFNVCVSKLGANACPAPYTKQWTAGSDAVDTRSCNTCMCETKACAGTVSLFSANDCSTGMGKDTIGPLTTTCAAQTDKNWTAMYYKTTLNTPTSGCEIQPGGFVNTMQGQITWTDQRTVCCKP